MKNQNTVFWVLQRIKRRIPAVIIMTVTHVGNALLGVWFALNTRQVIDGAVSGSKTAFCKACVIQLLIIIGILISNTVFRILKERVLAGLDRDWKNQLLHRLICGEYESVSVYHSGELINRMTNDVRILNESVVTIVPNLAGMAAKLAAISAALLSLEPMFGLLILVAGGMVMLSTGFMRRKLKALNKSVSESDGKVSGMLQEIMEKLLVIQAMDVGAEMEKRTDHLMEKRFHVLMQRKNVSLFANISISLMYYGAGFATLLYSASGLLLGTMTFGELTALTQLVSQIQAPFVNMSGFYPQYIAMLAAAERLKELYDITPVQEAQSDVSEIYQEMTCLEARNLSFTYDRNRILEDVSFHLPKGSFSVIVGSSGIGKSTLLKLLLGVYYAEQGGLYIKSAGREMTVDSKLRKLFAYVPQGNLLLSGTIRENLLLTRPTASADEIAQAIWVSAMDEYLKELPQGLDTVLRENAGGLSEGQAQRLSLARAVLSGAPILLLDEATSALDEATEAKVLSRIRSLKDRTCLVVTHRQAAIELCDYQLRIVNRKIEQFCTKK